MMKKFIIFITLLVVVGCNPASPDEVLLNRSDISLSWKNDVQISYSPESHQMGCNINRNEYRIYDDRLANWFIISCSEKPVEEGQILSADVSWTGKKSTKSFKGIEFLVEKTNDEGLVWLWNSSNYIGIIIKHIQ